MIANLKPYPAMKDSDVEWLGEVPEHWDLRRGKSVFRCIDIRSQTGNEELLTVSSARGVVPRRSTSVTMFKAESYVGHKLCWPGDLVINSLWAWARGLGVSSHHGIVSTAYGVYRPKADVNPRFIHELVRSTPFHWELRVRSKGVWTSRLQLTDDSFLGAPFLLPPLPEQAAIVRFIETIDRRIRRYIRAKQKLIRLLEEQKQAIIHRAVTRGLDPNVPLKDSGVEWLGQVPKHWVMRKLRHCGPVVGGMTPSMEVRRFWDGETPWVTPKDMKKLAIGDSSIRVTTAALEETSLRLIEPRAILLVVRGMILARKVPIAWTENPVTINQDMKAIRPNKGVDAKYLATMLDSAHDAFVPLIDEAGHGTKRLPTERWRDLAVMIPPLEEQVAIVEHLDQATADIDTAIARANREIELLNEYRTRLIADVVTGKLDVREAAASLPDDAEEPEAMDDLLPEIDEPELDGSSEAEEIE